MVRHRAGLIAVLLLLSGAAAAQDPAAVTASSVPPPVQAELRLERRLLALDLVSFKAARERDQRARQAVGEVLARLDEALAGEAVTLGLLEDLQDELDTARAAARIAEERLNGQLAHIQERLRRIGLMEGETGSPAAIGDPLTGRWQVTITPQNLAAVFDLRLSGTVVSGSYQVAGGGSAGSFRGTYTGGKLRLERVDASGGFDSVWEGTVAGGRIVGTWMSNELVTGQPNRGGWIAAREGGP